MTATVPQPDLYRAVALLLSLFTATLAPLVLLRTRYERMLPELIHQARQHYDSLRESCSDKKVIASAQRLHQWLHRGRVVFVYAQDIPIIFCSAFALAACGWIVYWWSDPQQPDISHELRIAFAFVAALNLGCFIASLVGLHISRLASRQLTDVFYAVIIQPFDSTK
jgi:hypothetical protein